MASSYPASRAIAAKVANHFSQSQCDLSGTGQANNVATPPSAEEVEALVTEAFWASLRRNEGYRPTISLAYLAPEQSTHPLLLDSPLRLEADALARLAPAVERPGVHLGVWSQDGQLVVWGATHTLPAMCFVLEVVSPGLLVIKQSSCTDVGKYTNVAVLEGDRVKELITESPSWPDCPAMVRSLLGISPVASIDSSTILVQLAASMRKHGRGGALLVVPTNSDDWRSSILPPMGYTVTPLYTELRDQWKNPETRSNVLSSRTLRVVDMVAGLTAVDGASLVTADCELLGFGAKITRRDGQPAVDHVVEMEPIADGAGRLVHPTVLGGTRHLSAAQFVQDQRDSIALVASQDGRFTVFAWGLNAGTHQGMVHAYRVETLLL